MQESPVCAIMEIQVARTGVPPHPPIPRRQQTRGAPSKVEQLLPVGLFHAVSESSVTSGRSSTLTSVGIRPEEGS